MRALNLGRALKGKVRQRTSITSAQTFANVQTVLKPRGRKNGALSAHTVRLTVIINDSSPLRRRSEWSSTLSSVKSRRIVIPPLCHARSQVTMLTCAARRGRRGSELRGTAASARHDFALTAVLMGHIWARQDGSFAATQTTDNKEDEKTRR